MKTILEKLKRYKWAVLAVGIVALILLVFFIYKYSKKHQQLPVNPAEKITFVKASPPSGLRQTINPWEDNTEYRIKISGDLTSIDGVKLGSPIDYLYLNVTPTNIEGGGDY